MSLWVSEVHPLTSKTLVQVEDRFLSYHDTSAGGKSIEGGCFLYRVQAAPVTVCLGCSHRCKSRRHHILEKRALLSSIDILLLY
jgi:hypothetical protein